MAVCIAGMHRSGTSMVARLLNLCGLDLGPEPDLIPPAKDNPEGFWENTRFIAINDELLKRLGGAWDVVPRLASGWEQRADLADLRQSAAELVSRFAGRSSEAWGWKDPRNSLLFPFWKVQIPQLKVLVCLRNPLDVAQSLYHRSRTSLTFGLKLWLSYTQPLLEQLQPQDRVVTHYDAYFEDTAGELRRVLEALGMAEAVGPETLAQACSGSSLALRHNRCTTKDLVDAGAPLELMRAYARLCAEAGPLCQAALRQDPGSECLGPLAAASRDAAQTSGAAPSGPQGDGAPQTGGASGNGLTEAEGRQAIQRLLERLAGKDDEIKGLRARAAEKDRQYQEIVHSLSWRLIQSVAGVLYPFLPLGRRAGTPTGVNGAQPAQLPRPALATPSSSNRTAATGLLPSRNPLVLAQQVYLAWSAEGWQGVIQAYRRRKTYLEVARNPGKALGEVSEPPAVSIVIPVFNNLQDTQQCIQSMLGCAGQASFEIIVVDNCSTDGTEPWLTDMAQRHPPTVRFVRNERNLGFAGAVNVGAGLARGRYLCVANNDIVVTRNWLDELVKAAESDPAIGIVSPLTNHVGEGPQLLQEFEDIAPEQAQAVADELQRRQWPLQRIVDRLVFFCVLVRRDLWDLIGGLAGAYGLGNFEDDDFCLRARLAGFTLALDRQAFVFHHGSRTFKKQRISHSQLMEKNRRIFYERTAAFATRLLPRLSGAARAPAVSVIVRTVDRPALLRQALTSLANQTFTAFEVVLVNDGGPDLGSLLKEFEGYLSIQYLRHERPVGRTAALNRGLRAARGQWMGYLDDDDIVYPLHLELLMDAARLNPGTQVVYGDWNKVLCHATGHGEDVVLCRTPAPSFEFQANAFLVENRIPIMSALHSRRCLEKAGGGFDETLDLLEDWDFWLRLSQRAEFRHVPRVTSEYRFRVSGGLANSVTARRIECLEALLRTYERYPVSDAELLKRRSHVIQSMNVQVQDLRQIEAIPLEQPKRSYLTICRVTGLSPADMVWSGYRA